MRIGLVYDHSAREYPSGAGRLADRLTGAAVGRPFDLIPCQPGALDRDCDGYVALDTERFSEVELQFLADRPLIRWVTGLQDPAPQARLNDHARWLIFSSPLQQQIYAYRQRWDSGPGGQVLPPPLDPAELQTTRARWASEERGGTIWFGRWTWSDGVDLAMRWAGETQSPTNFYSASLPPGTTAPHRFAQLRGYGPPEVWWDLVAQHQRYVFLPREPIPFGYGALEAHLLGLEVTLAGRVGVESFGIPLDELAARCAESGARFWETACQALA